MTDDNKKHGSVRNSNNEEESFPELSKRFLWADSSSAVERVILGLGILCVLLFILDFIIHRHTYVPGEGLPGFYTIVGFLAFTLIVLGAASLRRLILRSEDYYAPFSVDSEEYPEQGLEIVEHKDSGSGIGTKQQHNSSNSSDPSTSGDRP